MEKIKVGFFECEGWEEDYIKRNYPALFEKFEFDFFYEPLQEVADKEDIGKYSMISVFIYSNVNKNVVDKLSNCKVVITRSMGYDHLDLGALKEKGITPYNIYDYGTNTVAEYTILLMLMLLRKSKEVLYDYNIHEEILPRKWRGNELQGKKIGIVGTGNIGTRVIELLQPFNVEIYAYSRHPKEVLMSRYGVNYVDSFNDLLQKVEILSFHVPLTPQTKHMLNTHNIKYLREGAYIVNTSRGGVIETEAIIEGLNKGLIKGIAMDVFEGEKLERIDMDILLKGHFDVDEVKKSLAHQLLRHKPNVIITPHIAYDTKEALQRILSTTIKIIKGSMEGSDEIRRYIISQ